VIVKHEHCPRIILYLGAGASQFAGYRTFADFPQLLFDANLRQSEGLPPLTSHAEKILKAIKDSLERTDQPTTHDRFLWRLDGYSQLLKLNQCDSVLQAYLRDSASLFDLNMCTEDAVNRMATTTIRHYSTNRVQQVRNSDIGTYTNMQRVYDLYIQIASLNGNPAFLPIFTTNYDMLLEDIYAEFGSQSNGFGIVNGIPNVTAEGKTWSPRLYETCSRSSKGLYFYRLHGCACWFYHHQGDSEIYFHRWDASQQPTGNLCAMYPGLERERGAGPHGFGFRKLYSYLQVCELMVFIGFSFRDDDVMHVLLKILAERRGDLKVLIIDNMYTPSDVQGRLKEAARRSTFPSHVPTDREIIGMRTSFGLNEQCVVDILKTCRKLLKKE
jgi:hypothetical protein